MLVSVEESPPTHTKLTTQTMQSKAKTAEEYLAELDDERRKQLSIVRNVVLENLPDGYEEMMLFGMITYAVPLSILPRHIQQTTLDVRCPSLTKAPHGPLPHQRLRRRIGREVVQSTLRRATGKRLDMGKSCVRFRKLDDLPLELVGEVIGRTPIGEFIEVYKASRSPRKRKKQTPS